MNEIMDGCGDALVDPRALYQAKADILNVNLDPYREKIKKEMEEKRMKRKRLMLPKSGEDDMAKKQKSDDDEGIIRILS